MVHKSTSLLGYIFIISRSIAAAGNIFFYKELSMIERGVDRFSTQMVTVEHVIKFMIDFDLNAQTHVAYQTCNY